MFVFKKSAIFGSFPIMHCFFSVCQKVKNAFEEGPKVIFMYLDAKSLSFGGQIRALKCSHSNEKVHKMSYFFDGEH